MQVVIPSAISLHHRLRVPTRVAHHSAVAIPPQHGRLRLHAHGVERPTKTPAHEELRHVRRDLDARAGAHLAQRGRRGGVEEGDGVPRRRERDGGGQPSEPAAHDDDAEPVPRLTTVVKRLGRLRRKRGERRRRALCARRRRDHLGRRRGRRRRRTMSSRYRARRRRRGAREGVSRKIRNRLFFLSSWWCKDGACFLTATTVVKIVQAGSRALGTVREKKNCI